MNSRIKEDVQRLFEFWCEISPPSEDGKTPPQIVESFPESFRDPQILTDIPHFAFPCKFENKTVQTYSFVLTSTDSKWRFGFCRHESKSATAMLIISYLPWHDSFIKFLNVLAELKKSPTGEFRQFLTEAYSKGVPEPGASLKLFYDRRTNNFIFPRPSQFQLPSIPENHNLNLYYNFVEPKNMIAVFAAMLAERRIIFTSCRLDILSSCIQASNSFLYPMVWQHIFIPILPMKMKDFLSAPMPYLIGVPEAVLASVRKEEMGDVVILNCDKKTLETPFDDVKNLPSELVSQLKKHLNNPAEHRGDRVSKIFLGILVQLIGGYRDAVKFSQYSQGQKITWDREAFIETRPPSLRPFLKNMLDLQIFQQFIDERLEMLNTGLGFSDEFELETLRYAERSGKRVKQYKEFLKNVKDKTNPAVKSAVKSVKESSKGVKTAYKDLKSKFRDSTPPKSRYEDQISRSNGGGSSSGGLGHHSAPSSPVFTKRPLPEVYRKPSQPLPKFNNNNINKSPAISPPSSNSSSEMNILQELQQHALFKTPVVDRSLKPTNSLDYPIRPPRTGAPASTPNKSRVQQIQEIPIGTLCTFDTIPSDTSLNSSSRSSNSLFDSPPEMPSPPVPPRPYLKSPEISSLCLSFENSFVNKNVLCVTPEFVAPPPPLAPKSIRRESDMEKDLIKLDTSFEISDFDPLNTNAKPLPISKTTMGPSSSVVVGFNNPLYPYVSPIHQPQSQKSQRKDCQEEMELLRDYGLDQFSIRKSNSISNGNHTEHTSGPSGQLKGSFSSSRNNWTTFD